MKLNGNSPNPSQHLYEHVDNQIKNSINNLLTEITETQDILKQISNGIFEQDYIHTDKAMASQQHGNLKPTSIVSNTLSKDDYKMEMPAKPTILHIDSRTYADVVAGLPKASKVPGKTTLNPGLSQSDEMFDFIKGGEETDIVASPFPVTFLLSPLTWCEEYQFELVAGSPNPQ